MRIEELKIMKDQMVNPFRYAKTDLWKRAFQEYNDDHKEDRPLHTGCRHCYYKVFKHLNAKLYSDSVAASLENPGAETK